MKTLNPEVQVCPGIVRRTLVTGRNMYQMVAILEAGSKLPEHHHEQEQILHILSGRLRLSVQGETHDLVAGDSFYLASNVAHAVEALELTRVLDTFSPPRQDYLELDEAARTAP